MGLFSQRNRSLSKKRRHTKKKGEDNAATRLSRPDVSENLSKVILRTSGDSVRVDFLKQSFQHYLHLKQYPAFMFVSHKSATPLSAIRDVKNLDNRLLMQKLVEFNPSVDIVKYTHKDKEVVFFVRGQFEANWFYTLANVMGHLCKSHRSTKVDIIYGSGFVRKTNKRFRQPYANKPTPTRHGRS